MSFNTIQVLPFLLVILLILNMVNFKLVLMEFILLSILVKGKKHGGNYFIEYLKKKFYNGL